MYNFEFEIGQSILISEVIEFKMRMMLFIVCGWLKVES